MMIKLIFLLILCAKSLKSAPNVDGDFEFIILHNNDMHARFEQININGNKCKKSDSDANRCFGGFARVAHEVREYRKNSEDGGTPVLYLNAGDTYTGTPWFQLYKENITSAFLNALKPDAISLGNHEFDEGTQVLGHFLTEIKFPVLAANIKIDQEPTLKVDNLKKSHIFEVEGRKIGVIGYLTPETKNVAIHNNVEFEEEIDAINRESKNLKSQGINIIIALGHSGIEKDKLIAAECDDVDLVIGGHSHTFLYTGQLPSNDQPFDDYPVNITQKTGKMVPVVQAYAYTKYLGKLHLTFDNEGNLKNLDGAPILLNGTIPRDQDFLDLLNTFRPGIEKLEKEVVGVTKVKLDGNCRRKECNLGNLIADSMVDWYAQNFNSMEFWTDASIALLQSGGIRGSIDNSGNITMEDVITVLPFESKLEIVEITGEELMRAFEHSVHRYESGVDNGEFLQYSGVQIVYDMSKPVGQRVADVKVLCVKCRVPEMVSVNMTEKYKLVVVDFLANGGDGYDMFIGKSILKSEKVDLDVLNDFLRRKSPVFPSIERRIDFKSSENHEDFIGMTKVLLDGNCTKRECNLGNFIADSMVDMYATQFNNDRYWTDASIALIEGSKIFNSISANHKITQNDVMNLFGSSSHLHIIEVSGNELKNLLEFSISHEKFLQISGLEFSYNKNRKISDLKFLCSKCQIPELQAVQHNENYKIIVQSSLAAGNDDIYKKSESTELNITDVDAFLKYLQKKSPIYPSVDLRIKFDDSDIPTPPPTTQGSSNLIASYLIAFFSILFTLSL